MRSLNDWIDPREFEMVAQLSHFGWGVAVVLAGWTLGGETAMVVVGALWVLYAAVKEFWYDEKYERPVVRGSSGLDFTVEVVGALVGMSLVWLR